MLAGVAGGTRGGGSSTDGVNCSWIVGRRQMSGDLDRRHGGEREKLLVSESVRLGRRSNHGRSGSLARDREGWHGGMVSAVEGGTGHALDEGEGNRRTSRSEMAAHVQLALG